MKKSFLLILMLLLTFSATAKPELKKANWNDTNYQALQNLLQRSELNRAETLIAAFDCDNTTWAGDISDSVFQSAVQNKQITWQTAPIVAGYLDSTNPKTTYANPFDYYNALYDVDPVISYNYIPQAFAGHTLNEIQTMYNTAKKAADFPKPYKEIVDLTKVLSEHGITVAFVSASPIFLVAPMLQDHKLDVPLSQMEGIDVYVQDPQSNQAHPVLLSNLFQTQGITTWKEFLRSYGHYMVLPRASEIMNAREGKALGVMSVAARHVAQWNVNHASAITLSDMRLALMAGDNYAPFSDITHADPEQSGNDQGMARSLPFLSQAVVLNLYKTIHTPQGIDFNKKLKNHLAYWALATQLKQYEPHLQFLEQTAIYEGKQLGFATQVPPQK